MPEITGLNGNPVGGGKITRLTLEYDLSTGKLALGGDMHNLDLVLNVLAQATRYYEAQYHFGQSRAMSAQQAQDEKITRMISH